MPIVQKKAINNHQNFVLFPETDISDIYVLILMRGGMYKELIKLKLKSYIVLLQIKFIEILNNFFRILIGRI